MKEIYLKIGAIKDFQNKNRTFLEKIIHKINIKLEGKRKVMYSDIINYINRNNYSNKNYNEIIIWCNYKIRYGAIFVDL
ncbi:MAG: hypothetical protein P8Y70_13040 [Candidatus Lokiarchaeota archaeon]